LFHLFGFFLPSVVPAGKYSVWSAEGLPGMSRAISWWAVAGGGDGGGGDGGGEWGGGRWGWGGGSWWQWHAHLFSQCIVRWRSISPAGGQGAKVSTLLTASPSPAMAPVSQPDS
jgi:hypothetical protein